MYNKFTYKVFIGVLSLLYSFDCKKLGSWIHFGCLGVTGYFIRGVSIRRLK